MSSIVSKELLKSAISKFINNGHSTESSYLIVKYFIGLKESKILDYQEQMNKNIINFGVKKNENNKNE